MDESITSKTNLPIDIAYGVKTNLTTEPKRL